MKNASLRSQATDCFSVASFGTVKAYFTFYNQANAANALDWSFGVIIVSTLYILGLYENNPLNIMPRFFTVDYSTALKQSLSLLLYMTGASLAFLAFRLGYTSELVRIPRFTSPFTLQQISEFGMDIYWIGVIFLAPISVAIVLSCRLLVLCWECLPGLPQARKFFQGPYLKVGNFIYTHFPLPQIPIRFPFTKMICRVRKNGITLLFFLTVFALSTGASINLLGNAISNYRSSTDSGLASYLLQNIHLVIHFVTQ